MRAEKKINQKNKENTTKLDTIKQFTNLLSQERILWNEILLS